MKHTNKHQKVESSCYQGKFRIIAVGKDLKRNVRTMAVGLGNDELEAALAFITSVMKLGPPRQIGLLLLRIAHALDNGCPNCHEFRIGDTDWHVLIEL